MVDRLPHATPQVVAARYALHRCIASLALWISLFALEQRGLASLHSACQTKGSFC